MKHLRHLIFAVALAAAVSPAAAQSLTGSAGCTALVQSAANAAAARIAADDADIAQPKSIKTLTCLDNFFNGTGLNVVINLLNPENLLKSIESQICNKLNSVWQNTIGQKQCGITLTGFKIGFLGGANLGGGLSCPKLSFGGGGPPIASIGDRRQQQRQALCDRQRRRADRLSDHLPPRPLLKDVP